MQEQTTRSPHQKEQAVKKEERAQSPWSRPGKEGRNLSRRVALGGLTVAPLGFVTVEARPGCLFLTSFHTFPGENTVVKTQSLIEKRTGERGA